MKFYLALFSLIAIIALATAAGKQCSPRGGYCQSGGDCCSRQCLSYSYKCVGEDYVAPPPTIRPPNGGIKENCMAVGGYCQMAGDCCSGKCLSFSYKCVQ